MQNAVLWSTVLQTGQSAGAWVYLAHATVGVFATALFSLTLYAWSRRRNVGLLLVSSAFLVFTLKEVIWILPEMYNSFSSSIDLVRTLLDLLVLGLFFAAVMIRPRKQLE